MNDRNSRNDKIMDIILEAAAEKYVQKIAEEENQCNMSEEEERRMAERRELICRSVVKRLDRRQKEAKPRRRFTLKKCFVLVAVLAVLVGLAMNVSAFRAFFFKTYTELSGDILKVKTEPVTEESFDKIQEFADMDEVIVPGWIPPGMTLTEIVDYPSAIILSYRTPGGLWVSISENLISSYGAEAHVAAGKNKIKESAGKVLGMDAVILELESEIGLKVVTATWNSDAALYEVSTNGSKAMMDAILQDLKYLR